MLTKLLPAAAIAICLLAPTGFAQTTAPPDNDNENLDKGLIYNLKHGTLTPAQKTQLRRYLIAGGATAVVIAGILVTVDSGDDGDGAGDGDGGGIDVTPPPGGGDNGGGDNGNGGDGDNGGGDNGGGGTGGTGTGGTGGTGTGGTGGTGTGATGT